jgi:uncharacterized membrane protein YheB (UPF0754 family)
LIDPFNIGDLVLNINNISLLIIPPIAGTIIGYFTNDIAIKMLFRPYTAKYIGKYQLPFTPGVIPRNQERLAQKISDTIMGSLLTPSELQKLAQKLLETERVSNAILWLLKLALQQIQEDKQQKTTKVLADILKDLFGQSLPRLLKVWSRRKDFLEPQINSIFDQILLEFRLNENQAKQLTSWILEYVLSPEVIRLSLIEFLTEKNIQVIDEGFREKSSGTYWVIANLFGLQNSLIRLRNFCLEEKEITNARLKELLLSLEVRTKIREWLQQLTLQNLPVSTVKELRKTTTEVVQNYLQEKTPDLIEALGESINWNHLAEVIINRLRNSEVLNTSLEVISQELALILERYLESELEEIVAQIIPILAIDQVIVERVKATSPAELEAGIQGIVKTELQAIVNLGGILGLLVGLMQTIFLLVK